MKLLPHCECGQGKTGLGDVVRGGGGSRVKSLDVSGETAFLCKAFATVLAKKGRGGVDGITMLIEIRLA